MAGQVREPFVVFGSAGVVSAPTQFAEFGSLQAGNPIKTTDIATIMLLPAWTLGLQNTIYAANGALALEDDNSWRYVHSYQIGQILQDGVPQWEAAQVYQIGSIVQDNANLGQLFACLVANTVGGSLPVGSSNATWKWITPPLAVIQTALTPTYIPMTSLTVSNQGPANSQYIQDSPLRLVDGNIKITSGNLQFSDGSVQTKAATSVLTSRSVNLIGGLRGFGTIVMDMANATKPRFVMISAQMAISDFITVLVGTTSSPPPAIIIARAGSPGGTTVVFSSVSFWVMPGEYYDVTAPGSSNATWFEWN